MAGQLTPRKPRSLFPWSERDPFQRMQREMDDLFSRFFGEGEQWFEPRYSPTMDMYETDDAFQLRFDLPGIDAGAIDVQLREGVLTITGERKEEETEGKRSLRCERGTGPFSRTVTLPRAVKEDKIDAQYHDGVLTITVPKMEAAKTRRIEVKS